jgi:hypothetical protein
LVPDSWQTGVVNRRLRLALLLAALAAAGPSAAAPQALEATRPAASICWFRVAPAQRAQLETTLAGPKTRRYADPVESPAESNSVLLDTLRVHSLFQRPPPLHS